MIPLVLASQSPARLATLRAGGTGRTGRAGSSRRTEVSATFQVCIGRRLREGTLASNRGWSGIMRSCSTSIRRIRSLLCKNADKQSSRICEDPRAARPWTCVEGRSIGLAVRVTGRCSPSISGARTGIDSPPTLLAHADERMSRRRQSNSKLPTQASVSRRRSRRSFSERSNRRTARRPANTAEQDWALRSPAS